MRKLYLHIGMPKTGTTAIQRSLSASRDRLRAHGLAYPGEAVDHAMVIPLFHQDGPHHRYYKRRKIAPEQAIQASRALFDDISSLSQSFDGDLLLSSEYLRTLSKGAIDELDTYLRARGYELVVLCYARHPVPAAISTTQQNVKVGIAALADLIEQPRWHSLKTTLAAPLESVGRDRIILRPYEEAKEIGAEKDILRTVGYKGPLDTTAAIRTNKSLSATAVWLIDAYNRLRQKTPPPARLRSRLLKIEGPRFTLPERTVELVRDRGAEEVAWVKEQFGIELEEPRLEGEWPDFYTPEAARSIVSLMMTRN